MAFNFATYRQPAKKSTPINFGAINLTTPKSSVPKASLVPNISTPLGKGQTQANGSIVLVNAYNQPTGKVIYSGGSGASTAPAVFPSAPSSAPAIPRTITASTGGSVNNSSLPSPVYLSPQSYQQRTITSTRPATSSFVNTPITTSSLASTPSIVLPSAPISSNPGTINNKGLVNALSDGYQYDPTTNLFVTKQADTTQIDQTNKSDLQNMLNELIPKKENINNDAEIKNQRAEVAQKQQIVSDYTAQLNNVIAQQNTDLLKVRGIGSQEGVTETVYGGQAATINREAAIKALPIQAAIAATQENLKLAEDYLTQLTTFKMEEINNTYAYKTDLYNSVRDFVKGEEKKRLDELTKQEGRIYNERLDNINAQDQWTKFVIQNGQGEMVGSIAALNPASPNFRQELATITQRLKQKADTQVIEANGRKLLVNSQTGATVRDLGSSGSGSAEKTTQTERQQYTISQFQNNFVQGQTLVNGTPVLDSDGYMTPEAWKATITHAPNEGLPRAEFIKQFGYLIVTGDGTVSPAYGLTPADLKLIGATARGSE